MTFTLSSNRCLAVYCDELTHPSDGMRHLVKDRLRFPKPQPAHR